MLLPRSRSGTFGRVVGGVSSGGAARLSRLCLLPIAFIGLVLVSTFWLYPQLQQQQAAQQQQQQLASTKFAVGDDNPPPNTNLAPPLSREELGRASWALLHTMAAKYPDKPTPKQQQAMLGIIDGLAELYPCSSCAKHFRLRIDNSPPDVSNRKALSRWLCQSHNAVNLRNQKPLFECDTLSTVWTEELRNDCGCKDRADDANAAIIDKSALATDDILNGGADAQRIVDQQRAADEAALEQAKDGNRGGGAVNEVKLVNGGNGVVKASSTKLYQNDEIPAVSNYH